MGVAHFVLIPFLLGVQVPDEHEWKYGPEYTFDFNTTLMLNTVDQREAGLSQKNIKIICKPVNPTSLQCRTNDSIMPFTLFEIHVNYLVGKEPRNPWRVSKQLHKLQNIQKFKSVNQQCMEWYTMSQVELKNKTLSAPFRLTWHPNDTMEPMVTRINRVMEDVDPCDPNIDFLYAGRDALVLHHRNGGNVNDYLIMFQRNSTYSMTITPDNFVLSMKNTIIRDYAYHTKSATNTTVEEMSFSLSSIGPAKSAERVPELDTDGIVSIHVPNFEF